MQAIRLLALAALLAASLAPAAAAQGRGRDLTISLQGITSADLEVVNEAGSRERIAQLVAGAPVTVARSGLLGKTQRTSVQVQRTSDRTVVLLSPGGNQDQECNRIAPGSLEECQTIGVFINRPGAELTLNSLGGVIDLITNSPWRRGRIGLEGQYSSFTRLDKVACSDLIAGLTDCSVEKGSLGPGLFAEYDILPSLSVSARFGMGGYQVDQSYGSTDVNHDVSVTSLDLGLQYRFGTGPLRPFLGLGPSMYFNSSDILSGGTDQAGRSESGIRLGGGMGFDFMLGDRMFGRAHGSYWSGGSDDADTNFRFAFGAGYNF